MVTASFNADRHVASAQVGCSGVSVARLRTMPGIFVWRPAVCISADVTSSARSTSVRTRAIPTTNVSTSRGASAAVKVSDARLLSVEKCRLGFVVDGTCRSWWVLLADIYCVLVICWMI